MSIGNNHHIALPNRTQGVLNIVEDLVGKRPHRSLMNNRFPIPFRVDMSNIWPVKELGNRVLNGIKEVLTES